MMKDHILLTATVLDFESHMVREYECVCVCVCVCSVFVLVISIEKVLEYNN